MDLQRGQKTKLDALTPSRQLVVDIQLAPPAQTDVDISCFGLDGEGKLSDDRYFVFYNQTASPCKGLQMEAKGEGKASFQVDLNALPGTVRKLVFAATLDGPGTMGQVGGGTFGVKAEGQDVARFPISGGDYAGEKAIMIAEVYVKAPAPDTTWRLAAVGQGFNGGLQALLEHFGGEAASPAPAAPAAPAATPAAEPPKVNLGKLTLNKRGDAQRLSLDKSANSKPIHINLNWHVPKASGLGGLLGMKKSADLDLGCMWELADGSKGVIQPLGRRFGSKVQPPFIYLDQDDRSGSSANGENMYLFRPETLRRCVIFAMIYEGSSNFTEVEGRVTLSDGRGTEIEVRMDAPQPSRTFCAVCSIEHMSGDIQIRKEEMYFRDHEECDHHFGFGFRWVAGSK